MDKPAISMSAMPGRRQIIIDAAVEAEKRGFAGIYCPTFGDGVGLCQAIGSATKEIRFGTSIANIYARHPVDYAQTASFIHEMSGGRFDFGVGVSHDSFNEAMGLKTGKPLTDMRNFVATYRKAEKRVGVLPPLVLATLRKKMVRLAGEIGDGVVWANAARSHMRESLAELPSDKLKGFFVGNMIPTCVSEDRAAAAAITRRALRMYLGLPNYQKYWEEAGYGEEIADARKAGASRDKDRLDTVMSERWLRDVTLFGNASEVRGGYEEWLDVGVTTPIIVPSSANGGQSKAIAEIFSAFS